MKIPRGFFLALFLGLLGYATTALATVAPAVTAIAPASGSLSGGLAVTITGTDFTGATAVTIGGTAATAFTVVDDTTITATTPPHALGMVDVAVTTAAGSSAANTLFTYVPTGSLDAAYDPDIADVTGTVFATAVLADGSAIIGGNFTTVGGAAHANIARINADGSVDATFTAGTDNSVYCVTVQADGKLVLGGNFTSVNGSAVDAATGVNRIARLNADGSRDTAFHSSGGTGLGGANGEVVTVAMLPNGRMIIGGTFTTVGGATHTNIARLNADGSVDAAFTANTNNSVYTVAVQADGKLVIGGAFTSINGEPASSFSKYVGRLNADGTLDGFFNGFTFTGDLGGTNDIVWSVAVQADGKLVVGGAFTKYNGSDVNYITRLNSNGKRDLAFSGGANSEVRTVAVQADGKLVIGGYFTSVAGSVVSATTGVNRIARLNVDGTLDSAFNSDGGTGLGGADGNVFSAAAQADGRLVLGGDFTSVNGTPRNRLARLTNDTATQSLTAADTTQVLWTRGGASPELSHVSFEQSTDGGSTYTALPGTVTRIGTTPNWQLTDLGLPANVRIRARGRAISGDRNGSSGLVESVAVFNGLFTPAPTVTGISPASGSEQGGTAVTITGTNFRNVTTVAIGGTAATAVTVVNSTTLTATTPVHPSGTVDVAVTTTAGGTGTGSGLYTYLPAPTVTGISPASGNPLGATAVTITGTNFTGTAAVTIGGAAATNVTVVNPTTITATTAAHAVGTVDVVVTTVGGSGTGSGLYTYVIPPPTVTGISPASGSTLGGTAVTITGTNFTGPNFTGTASVTIGGTAATNVSVVSATSITAIAPANAAGTASVLVTTDYGTNAANSLYTYVVPGPGWLDLLYNPSVNGAVFATAMLPDGRTVIGGTFTTVGGASHTNIARLNADGSVDSNFTASTDAVVNAVAVQADGKLVLGGNFANVNGSPAARIARLNADGSVDSNFTVSTDNTVNAVAVQADGKLVLGGNFTSVNSSAVDSATGVNRIARLNTDGTRDTAFNSNGGTGLGGANNTVNSVAVQADGKLVLGGNFTSINGSTVNSSTGVNRIARLNTDGTRDTTFAGGPGANAAVNSVAVQADGKLVLGGAFSSFNSSTASRIVRLTTTGARDSSASFASTAGFANTVLSVAVQADGKLVFGGNFANAGTGVNRIARLSSSGVRDNLFNVDSAGTALGGANLPVTSVAMQADGRLMLGGSFTSVNGTARNMLARLINDAATQSLSAADTTQLLWTRGGAAPEVSQVTFEQSTDSGSTYTALPGTVARVGTTSNWQLAGLILPSNVQIRARGRTASGYQNGSSGLVESVAVFSGLLPPPPTVTGIAPATGSSLGGTAVTITGTNLTTATAVTIGGTAATGLAVVNDTTLTATTPAHTTGTASVLVTTAGGSNSANTLFTYVAVAPVVASPASTAVTTTAATLGGDVTADGGAAVTERGVVFSATATNADPLIGGPGVTALTAAGTTGAFTVSATALAPGTTYSFKAYAINSAGTTYTSPVSTFSTLSVLENWRQTYFGVFANTGPSANLANPDSDGLNNLQEFAFGTDPNSAVSGAGLVTYSGGVVTKHGQPTVISNGTGYLAVFGRRKDYPAAALTYTVQFSADLSADGWEDSAATPTVVASDTEIEAVTVPFPQLLNSGLQAQFFRIKVSVP